VVHIVISVAEHCVINRKDFSPDCNASDEKKFSALQKNLHRKKSRLWRRAQSRRILVNADITSQRERGILQQEEK
jgi:hypothetical protein